MSHCRISLRPTIQGDSTHGSLLFLLPFKNVVDTSRTRIFPLLIPFRSNDSSMSCSCRGVSHHCHNCYDTRARRDLVFWNLTQPFIGIGFNNCARSRRGVCNQLHQKCSLNPIAPMDGSIGVLAPMVMEKVEQVSDRGCCFVFDSQNEAEHCCQVVFDILTSD